MTEFSAAVDAKDLHYAIQTVGAHVDPQASRYCLGSVQALLGDSKLRLTATDGRKLITATMPARADEGEVLIPAKELKKFRRGKNNTAKLAINGTAWAITTRDTNTNGVRTEGRFPDWRKVFPTGTPEAKITGNAGELARLFFDPSDGRTLAVGESLTSTMPAEDIEFSSKQREIAFSGESSATFDFSFARQILAAWGNGEQVTIELYGPDRPAVFRSLEGRRVQVTALLMPIARKR